MSARLYLVVAVCGIMQGCATLAHDLNEIPGDLSKTLPPPAAGMPIVKSEVEAPRSSVQHIVDEKVTQTWQVADGTTDAAVLPVKTKEISGNFVSPLDGAKNGQDAINAFNEEQLGVIASKYDMTVQALKEKLLSDSTLYIDANGLLVYIDHAPENEHEHPNLSAIALPKEITDVRKLHSRPSATRKIFLQMFTGTATEDRVWGGIVSEAYIPFDFANNPGHRERVYSIWAGVAEDYAIFDVDVTTEEPTLDQAIRSNFEDKEFSQTIIFGMVDPQKLCPQGCSGVAYLGQFGSYGQTKWGNPVWVFPFSAGNATTDLAAVASHETGHALGLQHHGTHYGSTTEEYAHGFGGWFPLMGASFGSEMSAWSNGDYLNANNAQQHDIEYMKAQYQIGLPNSDTNKSFETAIPLQVASTTNNAINIKRTVGLIEDSTDVDYYSFTTNIENSLISFTVSNCVDSTLPCNDTLGTNWDNLNNGNLHVFARVYDEDKNVIKEIHHFNKVVAHISVMLPKAGRYYIEVSSGHGENYSNYGSVGQYIITGKYSSTANVSIQPTAKIEISNTEGTTGKNGYTNATYFLSAEHSDPGFSEITKYTWEYSEMKLESADLTNVQVMHGYSSIIPVKLTIENSAGLTSTTTLNLDFKPYKGQTVSVKSLDLKMVNGVPVARIKLQNKTGAADTKSTVKVNMVMFGNDNSVVTHDNLTATYNKKSKYYEVSFPSTISSGMSGRISTGISNIIPTSKSVRYIRAKNKKTETILMF